MTYEEYDSLIIGHEQSICYIADVKTYGVIHLTRAAMKMLGINSPEEYKEKKCYKLIQNLDAPCSFCTNDKLVLGKHYQWEHFNEMLNCWLAVDDTLIEVDGRLCRMEHAVDITDQKEKMQRMSDQLTLDQILVKCIHTLASSDDYDSSFHSFLEQLGRFYRASRAYIFEFDFERQIIKNTYEWCAPNVSAEIDNLQEIPMEYIEDWIKQFQEKGEFFITSVGKEIDAESEESRILKDQGIESLLAAPLFDNGVIIGFIGVDDPTRSTDDLTLLRASSDFVKEELKKRHLIKSLEFASYTDMLTGLQNRNKYMEVLKRYENDPPGCLGVIFADVNGLKMINDIYGHKYGDSLLVKVASILKEVGESHLYRIGGDEFVLLFENFDKDEFYEKVIDLRKKFQEEDCDVSLGCTWEKGDTDVSSQVTKADEMMYAEKQSYYKQVLSNGQAVRVGIASEVLEEIAQNRFVVFYQPQINIKTGEVIGAEALVRKKGKEDTLISPDKFISYYEMEGVIRHVDLFVLEDVCRTMKKWKRQGITLKISVNFSRVTLMEPDIVDEIMDICSRYHVSPDNLTIEVTESISKMDHGRLQTLIDDLIKKGFTISLDDFGSQYSNLSILNDLNFDIVKMDKTLVEGLESNCKSRVILKNAIQMCQELDSTHTLAEGIETMGQLRLLSDYSCEFGQGFFFSKPVSLEQFNELLSKNLKK
ncbi:sensor domain-containing phosphodiesterase [Anaerostipes sp.]|uniref:sensor domain-containing phosphodiesterase n=1 Tax=Anaerostipes sp. TaxID=1872530 RepID=UPI0025C3B1D9|nr:sensor domain-containing phosphodiesterase [Anaerostipes sp.]